MFSSKGIFDVLELAHSQIYRKAELEAAEAAEQVEGTLESCVGHVAPGLVMGLDEGP